jgi:hypothetical protein
MDDFVDVSTERATGNVFEEWSCYRIDFADAEICIDQIDPQRRLIQQLLMLFAPVPECTLGFAPEPRQLQL